METALCFKDYYKKFNNVSLEAEVLIEEIKELIKNNPNIPNLKEE